MIVGPVCIPMIFISLFFRVYLFHFMSRIYCILKLRFIFYAIFIFYCQLLYLGPILELLQDIYGLSTNKFFEFL